MKNEHRKELAVIVPVYGCGWALTELCHRLQKTLSETVASHEIILVNDGCPHDSWAVVDQLCEESDDIIGVELSRNFGQHPAITAGIHTADADWYVVMDCDLQDVPEDVALLLRTAQSREQDMVIAKRAVQDVAGGKRLTSVVFNKCLKFLSGLDLSPEYGNFRIFNRKVANSFLEYHEQMRFFPALMALPGHRVGDVDVSRPARPSGKSSYSPFKLFQLAFNAIVAHSIRPLYLGTVLGAVISLLAFASGLMIAVLKIFFDYSVEGWASLICAIAFLGGVQITLIGIVGVYVGKTFMETKKRPFYHVQRVLNDPEAPCKRDEP